MVDAPVGASTLNPYAFKNVVVDVLMDVPDAIHSPYVLANVMVPVLVSATTGPAIPTVAILVAVFVPFANEIVGWSTRKKRCVARPDETAHFRFAFANPNNTVGLSVFAV